uniref:Putative secreted protein n=1 Tax=Xenopsylla cheopis TaxID=163159 RepID=A0A6M2E0X7_XENCH
MKYALMSSLTSRHLFDMILGIPIASSVTVPSVLVYPEFKSLVKNSGHDFSGVRKGADGPVIATFLHLQFLVKDDYCYIQKMSRPFAGEAYFFRPWRPRSFSSSVSYSLLPLISNFSMYGPLSSTYIDSCCSILMSSCCFVL